MDEKPSPAEIASDRSQRYLLIGALIPLFWSIVWGGIATAVGAEHLDDPGVIFLEIALFLHIPTFFCVIPLTGLSPISSGNDTIFEYGALILATIPSCIFYGLLGKFIAFIINSSIAGTNLTPESNSPPKPQESAPPPSLSTDKKSNLS